MRTLSKVLAPVAAHCLRFEPFWRWLTRPDARSYPTFVRARYGAHVGQGTTINPKAVFYDYDYGLVLIGKDCAISGAEFVTHNIVDKQLGRWGFHTPTAGLIVVQDGCAIGMGARIQAPCSIGEGSIIGMGATITKDVPRDSIVVGANRILPMKASAYRASRIRGAYDDAQKQTFPRYRDFAGMFDSAGG